MFTQRQLDALIQCINDDNYVSHDLYLYKGVLKAILTPQDQLDRWLEDPHSAGPQNLATLIIAYAPTHIDRVEVVCFADDIGSRDYLPPSLREHLAVCEPCLTQSLKSLRAMSPGSLEI